MTATRSWWCEHAWLPGGPAADDEQGAQQQRVEREHQHPRDNSGKFSTAPGGGSKSQPKQKVPGGYLAGIGLYETKGASHQENHELAAASAQGHPACVT